MEESYYQRNRDRILETATRWQLDNIERARINRLAYWRKNRIDAINAYGGKCKCCGESELIFLVLDHVNDDGAQHRRKIGKGSIYVWAKKNGYPDSLQVLCHNCNHAKRLGICPHTLKN